MTPPINIDGSSVQDVTIDGQTVQEVTVDGQVVFTANTFQASQPVALSNLAAWWPFDPSAHSAMTNPADDATGGDTNSGDSTAYDGTVNSGTFVSGGGVTDVQGGPGSDCYENNGSGGAIDISSFDHGTPQTLMAWAKPDNFNQDTAKIFRARPSGAQNFSLAIRSGGWGAQTSDSLLNSTTSNTTAEFTHVCLRYGTSSAELFINGTEQTSIGSPATYSANSPAFIGSGLNNSRQFSGRIDDCRRYNTALSSSQISQIVTNTQP